MIHDHRVVFFCAFPPPFTGQTIGTQVVRDLVKDSVEVTTIDTSDGLLAMRRRPLGIVSRAIVWVGLVRCLVTVLKTNPLSTLYLVVSSSRLGHIRDALCVWAARRHAGRIVAHVRSGNFHENFHRRWLRPASRVLSRHIDAFVLLSEQLSDRLDGAVPAAKRVVIPNPIDRAVEASDAEVSAKLQSRACRRRLQVAFIGNMIPSKGYFDLALALPIYRRMTGTPIHVDLVGEWVDDADRLEFMALLQAKGVADAVTIHGRETDRSRIKALHLAADVLALPTYYPTEAQPRSIIEAMCAATPIIATRHASIPEFVEDGVCGILVPARSPESIARALVRLTDTDTWSQMATAARERYVKTFSAEVVSGRLERTLAGNAT